MASVAVAVGAILAYLNLAGKIVLPVTTPIVLVSGVLALVSDSGDGVFFLSLIVWGIGAGVFITSGVLLEAVFKVRVFGD